ncbi:MAG: 30S ribosomal protein S6 [Clostridiales bacterium]|nr:30S ribosomal protein S6 [Clostridiales bacterium]
MREYEVLYVMRPDLEEEKYQATMEKFTALIQNNGGEVIKAEPWGKRRLAYEIEKLREGYYVLLRMNCGADLPAELERNFKISDEVIRYLVTVKGE